MTVSRELEAEVLRLFHAEKWPVGTIARELRIHHEVVERVLSPEYDMPTERKPRRSSLDSYKPFLLRTLEEHPRLRAMRLFHMIHERGYEGSPRTVRRYVAEVRPRPRVQAHLVCERLPGEQAQVDWGKVGTLQVSGGTRVLWVFLMTLAYSRYRYAELVFDLGVESLRRSLGRALRHFGGTPREWLFDNTKAVVLERFGSAVRLNSDLLDFAASLHVMPRLCRPRTPTDKGAVERGIRDLKEAHFAGRTVTSREQGDRELLRFLDKVVCERPHPVHRTRTVRAVWEEERSRLLPLPDPMPTTDLVAPARVDKTASVCLGTNKYSVPPEHAGRVLTLAADDDVVRVLNGRHEVARHERCWGKHQRIDDLAHRRELVEQRQAAGAAPVRDSLLREVPELRRLFERWVEQGRNVGFMTSRTRKLRELYGVDTLREAVSTLRQHGTHDIGALALACEQSRRRHKQSVPLPLPLPSHVVDVEVPNHDLASYDERGRR